MPGPTPHYPPGFEREAVGLYRSSNRLIPKMAEELGIAGESLRRWIRQHEVDEGEREGITTAEREELGRLGRENRVLKQEREVLRKAAVGSTGRCNTVGFSCCLDRRCGSGEAGASRSGYYAWGSRPPPMSSRQDAALTAEIHEIHRRSRETYGYPRVHAELKALGTRCSRKRVERLTREVGLRGYGFASGRRRGTTRRNNEAAPAEDLLRRDSVATRADKVWVADITYVATAEGFLYAAFILVVHSRRVVGWAMEDYLRTELVVDALQMAVWRRNLAPGLIHHSDQGVQGGFNRYTALSFAERLGGGGHQVLDGEDREHPGQRHGGGLRLDAEGRVGEQA